MTRWTITIVAVLAIAGAATIAATAPDPMAWAYPHPQERHPPSTFQQKAVYTVPGSTARFTEAQLDNGFAPADWFPREHPRMPTIVAYGDKPGVMACSRCHLPNGQGGFAIPNLAGLPKAYIIEQLTAFRDGGRMASRPIRDVEDMANVARRVSSADGIAAAGYFAALRYRPWITVREASTVPKFGPTYWGGYQPVPGRGTVPLGDRIVELPLDEQRAEVGDPHAGYVAYVPPGSLAEGKAIAAHGYGGQPGCVSCHGANLTGSGVAPPLAGRSPTYLARQLWDMHTGHRTGGNAAMMQPIAARLTPHAIVAVAGYAASLRP